MTHLKGLDGGLDISTLQYLIHVGVSTLTNLLAIFHPLYSYSISLVCQFCTKFSCNEKNILKSLANDGILTKIVELRALGSIF